MKKTPLFLFTIGLFLFIFAKGVHASIVTVNSDGKIIFNVLADQIALNVPQKSNLEVKDVASAGSATNENISIKKEGDKVMLLVGQGSTQKTFDVTNKSEDLVTLEERANTKRINITTKDGKFAIVQNEVAGVTDYPIEIDPQKDELSVVTPSGGIFLAILPTDAAESALRSKYLSKITDKNMDISEQKTGILSYAVKGEKTINLFNLINYGVPVTTYISTSTGEVLTVDQPTWLRVVGFLFTS